MALTLEQESALLALLNEKRTTLPELSAATEVTNDDLLLINQMLADKSVTADVLKRFIAPAASTEQAGVIQLSNRIDSDSEATAATSRAVKTATDSLLSRSANLGDVASVPEVLRNLGIFSATTNQLGLVQLNDKTDSDSVTEAATANAVKKAAALALSKSANLSDLTDKSAAINNLGISDVPVGIPLPWPSVNVPSGYLKCNGAGFDKSLYPKLAQAYPSGVLPELRGEFIRGWDDGRGVDAGRGILIFQSDMIKAHNHELLNSTSEGQNQWVGLYFDRGNIANQSSTFTQDFGGSETRPRNIAFLYIVRAA